MSGDHHDAHPVPDEQRQAEAGLWPRRVSPAPSTPGEPPKCARCGREADARVHQVINGPGAEDAGRHNFTPGEPRTDSVSTGTKSAHPAPGEGTAWTDADRDRVWPEGWLKCPLHPDQHGDVYHSANWHEDRPPASGEGTRQRPGGWVDGIGWVVRSTDLRPGDKDEAAWVVRPGEVGSPFYSLAVVTRWADGTSPAPPAPLTRPDTAALRRFADGMVYDDLLTAARKGCFCEPHSKPCSDHMMYADGLEAGLRAATSPGTGDNP